MDTAKFTTMWQFVFLYSVYQIVLLIIALFLRGRATGFIDYVRAVCFIVAVLWILLYAFAGPSAIAMYYARTVGKNKEPSLAIKWVIWICDIIVHIAPALIMGIPRMFKSYAFAFALMYIWYLFARPLILDALGKIPLRYSDIALFIFAPVVVVAITASTFIRK